MFGRTKLQVWSKDHQCWRTAYVRPDQLMANVTLLRTFGMKFRVRS